MTLMTTSEKGRALIKEFEGCKLTAYKDAVGIPTIGYGHTKGVKMGQKITSAQAEEFLTEDLHMSEDTLNKLGINFTQNQFDALASWIFNLGVGKFRTSTLRTKIISNRPDLEITDQMVRWCNAGGKKLLGLMKRRVKEANLFLGKEVYSIRSNNIVR